MNRQHVLTSTTAIALAAVIAAVSDVAMGQESPQMTFFVTSVGLGDGANLGGLEGADAHCQTLAAAAGRGDATWRAYLSTQGEDAVNARDRIGTGPWHAHAYDTRRQIAADLGSLHGDTLEQARLGNAIGKMIALTEQGNPVNGVGDSPNQHDILTGSRPDGTAFPAGEDRTCRNWTSNGEGSAQVGHSDVQGGGNSSWNSTHPSRGCSQENLASTGGPGLFYCFAIDEAPPILQQIRELYAAAPPGTPSQQKISSSLLRSSLAATTNPLTAGARPTDGPDRRVEPSLVPADIIIEDGRVTVDIRGEVTPEVLERIDSLGGVVLTRLPDYRVIRAQMPLDSLESLAELDAIETIRPARRAFTRSTLAPQSFNRSGVTKWNTSQGDAAHRADVARRRYNVSGKGIGIGVISDGVDSLRVRQESGDLPSSVTLLSGQARPDDGPGGSRRVYDEGTAMLEIVHDLAPGADLYFATGFGPLELFAANIRALCAAGAHVIVDDVARAEVGAFQDNVVATAIADVVSDGCVYVSAAGNDGNKSKRTSGVWEGDYVPVAGDFHSFGGETSRTIYNRILVDDPGKSICLHWSEPIDEPASNYDIYLVDPVRERVVFPKLPYVVNGGQNPERAVECIGPLRWEGNSEDHDFSDYRLLVYKQAGGARFLRLQVLQGKLEISTAGATYGHAAAKDAIGVAAVDVDLTGGSATFGGAEAVARISSDGPRRIFYQSSGAPNVAAVASAREGHLREKPDVAAANRVSTATPGFDPFIGTSAAAAHVAAIAALVLEAAGGPGTVTPEEIRRILRDTALDIEAVGAWDRDSGAGIVDALAAVSTFR